MEGIYGKYPYNATQIHKIIEKSQNFVLFTGLGFRRKAEFLL